MTEPTGPSEAPPEPSPAPQGPAVSGREQATGRFRAGLSGNPKGRPRGARNRASVLAEELLATHVSAVVETLIQKALGGDTRACAIIIERLIAVPRSSPVSFPLPSIGTAAGVDSAMTKVLEEVARGGLRPDEAAIVSDLLAAKLRSLDVSQFEQRLLTLESAAHEKGRG